MRLLVQGAAKGAEKPLVKCMMERILNRGDISIDFWLGGATVLLFWTANGYPCLMHGGVFSVRVNKSGLKLVHPYRYWGRKAGWPLQNEHAFERAVFF
jgi:hypothetical protein